VKKLVNESLILFASLIGPVLSFVGVPIGAFTFVAYLFFYPPVLLFLVFIGECKTGDCYGVLAASAALNYLYYKFVLIPLLLKLTKRFKRN
jgi:hypothetical protein